MTRLGLPVRSGFTVTTDACRAHMESGGFPEGLAEELDAAVHRLEAKTGKTFGSTARPRLDYVSCSPFRVPVARLAAAHAALDEQAPATTSRAARHQGW
jgi:pyruvate,orthophosphate dikinase